ncbi:adenylyltransferase/cytidyltransferase family protein [Arthrobacter jiangjiafuii]|uniref:Adenylyltransferase/cytidyltransferase family protein n=1 Tax=Arthrobacter jiangjiafuii TaxID=2817475 RepID=A0A975R0B7_9MICC|nr:PfkB family carbohydrate kinase [Arthrobacter jiangjiafuii]MBP3042191.1 bifunctional heptose 7-phosphate kinase/heptose 1-phosphate adenyltransferase [Arthrobacter jiangjiafuii]QWC10037.1 adenylyltransferase/cytidyltransferase family protein [Arthrobacter jiangjiafuii]
MNIVVVGDVLLDADISGSAQRLSPDAPVPVVDVDDVRHRAGGAGLVARMLARDGHAVQLVTVLSDDGAAAVLREALAGIVVTAGPSGAPTPVKTRIRAGSHAVVRFDEGCAPPPPPVATDEMLAVLETADAVVVADYGRGLTGDPRLRRSLAALAGRIPVVWDPHPAGTDPVPGVAAVTPNLSEALRAAGPADDATATGDGTGGGIPAALRAAETLLGRWQSRAVVVTLGALGALVLPASGLPQMIPAPEAAAGDTCGAGDRFTATLALGLEHGTALEPAVEKAVQAAAAFLAAGGVASLLQAPAPRQLRSESLDALRAAEQVRRHGGTVVATGGCFDLLHAGHARTLSAARRLGDCLIVVLNSDSSVRRLKGEQRPIIGQQDRAELLLSLGCVDGVLIFEEDTPEAALDRLRPDIWVKGGDYREDQLPEARLVKTWGGETVTVPYHPARSTSRLAAALARVG